MILTPDEALRKIRACFTRLNSRPSTDNHERLSDSLNQFKSAFVISIMDENGDLSEAEMDVFDHYLGKASPIYESDEDYEEARSDRLRHKVMEAQEDALLSVRKPPLFFKRVVQSELKDKDRLQKPP